MARAPKKTAQDLLSLAFDQIGERGWSAFSFRDLAVTAKLPLHEVYKQISGRSQLLRQLNDRLDQAMFSFDLAELAPLSVRERLFELLMRRFDAMLPYKPALQQFSQKSEMTPLLLTSSLCNLDRMAERLLDAVGVTQRGLKRRLARRALMAAYVDIVRVWITDDGEDQALTMARLDKRLGQMEQAANWKWPGQSRASAEEDAAASA